ncbi:MAG: hypothetical protein D6674_04010 [Acidobacteria bacterium]|jgi:recombinational DNA repair protein (RecF pathway)|nr:MAG: hypothetical protein D6674_04010 [Acidobacteriota bacterium]
MKEGSKFLVLHRYVVGDEDLMVKVYGTYGIMKVYVPKGLRSEEGFLGFFEPSNLLDITYRQWGDIVLLRDIRKVLFLSYLALESYRRFFWMSRVLEFINSWFFYYEPELFSLAVEYLTQNPKNHETHLLKFKLLFLKHMGLYRDSLFPANFREPLNSLVEGSIDPERLKLPKRVIVEIDKVIESQLSSLL